MKLSAFQPKILGRQPQGQRLGRIKASDNYSSDHFKNIEATKISFKQSSQLEMLRKYYFGNEIRAPRASLPSEKVNLHTLDDSTPAIVWFGHSSYLIKYKGKNILVDPVFSGYAAPVSFMVNSFKGSDPYTAEDMPNIDLLILTHDHYDHMDYETLLQLRPKILKICTPLGVGEHLESWGYSAEIISELDWWQSHEVSVGIKLTATPARHFSGRTFLYHQTLWASFVLQIDQTQIFIGGDSGYDEQFKKIGLEFGGFDLAVLECGQYGKDWPLIHMFPEQTAQAATDLNARVLMPAHWGKFQLAFHAWYEPIVRLSDAAKKHKFELLTPKIGQATKIGQKIINSIWWES